MKPSERLAELGIVLPKVVAPVGTFVPALCSGSYILTSGQLPVRDGKVVYTGKVPRDAPLEDAADGAAIAALNGLAAVVEVAGSIDAIRRIVQVRVYVNSSPGFAEQPKVANGASDLLANIFGDSGRHVRSAVGVAELPLNAAVELELVVESTCS